MRFAIVTLLLSLTTLVHATHAINIKYEDLVARADSDSYYTDATNVFEDTEYDYETDTAYPTEYDEDTDYFFGIETTYTGEYGDISDDYYYTEPAEYTEYYSEYYESSYYYEDETTSDYEESYLAYATGNVYIQNGTNSSIANSTSSTPRNESISKESQTIEQVQTSGDTTTSSQDSVAAESAGHASNAAPSYHVTDGIAFFAAIIAGLFM